MTAKQSGLRGKVRDGTVVSDKMQKTVVVAVQANVRHRLYKKTVRRVRRLMAHDEREEAALGDRVRIIEAAPISRRKRWRLLEVLTRVELPEVAPESIDLDLLGEVKPEETEVEEAAARSDGAKAEPEEAVPAEAVPEAEAVVPEEVEVAEEVPEIETVEAAAEEPAAVEEEEAPDEPAESDEAPAESDEAPDEGEPS
ncbi:MAG: 30S ribosomal protein S17 [Chloroflexi bacterium]|nr:MAG: 30S ribosomal protein S17 [Chloroflexota bacterium]